MRLRGTFNEAIGILREYFFSGFKYPLELYN